ncbi:unnamed protein product [Rotaria sordida]|uniref:Cadherin domain-containing protein n=1 Tax=Rotaria sordida TaxID=392033 RepID=A0A814EPE7_9BILA|nr:unnamed protein product [Rotaria sordida]CAF1078690.1 unnamed protein product [Rotaria sordida]
MIKNLIFLLFSLSFIFCDLIELSNIIIREHTSIGHLLVKLNTSINQRYSYRFVNNNYREIQQYFSLNSTTGELRIAMDIDRELICIHHRHNQCKFLLKIFELYNEKLYYIPIIIDDINDHQPIFPYKTSEIILHISENSPPYQSKLFLQQAYDYDYIDNQNQLKYQLKNFDENFPFILELNNDLSNRLVLLLIETLDRELIDSYNCTLYVTDTNGHYTQLYIKIIIDDVNDQTPIFEKDIYSIELSENTSINTKILQVHAYDDDIGLNGEIIYDFTDASKQYNNIFSINNKTGVIYLHSLLDYEQRTSYLFYIEAHDLGKEIRSSQTLINITILDENDCYPIINFQFLPEINSNISNDIIEISENYSIDKFFVKIFIIDYDSFNNGNISLWFEILDNNNNNNNKNYQEFHLYQINNLTYLLNCTKSFDYEYQQIYYLKFYVNDFNLNKLLQTNKILTINILDENDNQPKFLQQYYQLKIYENNQPNIILTKIETFDPDNGENGRLTYEILTNENFLPFSIDNNSGILRCLDIFDREKRSNYTFDIIVYDHGYPISLSSKISIEIFIEDINDNKPIFEYDKYEFFLEENFPLWKIFASIHAYDYDLNTNLYYFIENENHFHINQYGELYLKNFIDYELKNKYFFFIIVTDHFFQTSVPISIEILDINDNKPQWKNPIKNFTNLFINKDQIKIGTIIMKFEAIDYDNITNGNGLVNYYLNENYYFLNLLNNGDLILNSTPIIGYYLLNIQAKDNGKFLQYSSLIKINLFINDNNTNINKFYKINSLTIIQRFILLITLFLSIIFIFIFIISMILIIICRYRKRKYLSYIKYQKNQLNNNNNNTKLTNDHNHSIDSNSNSSKLSLEDLHQKHLVDHSSSPSYTGANIDIQHHEIIKPTQTTSDYYNTDELADEQRSTIINNTEWSIEKILYPDWLYKDILMTSKKHLNTSTFNNINSYQTSIDEKQIISSNNQSSPKQVRFDYQKQIRSYPHLNTTVQQLKTRTITTVSNNDIHNTFI